MFRPLSLYFRKLQCGKEVRKTLEQFSNWKKEIDNLPAASTPAKKVLIIRLDDIGDYLLFRNSFAAYKTSSRWAGYEFTLLGFSLWQDLFNTADQHCVDSTIWINKKDYFSNPQYRWELWLQLRSAGFATVICPSRVRPLLLDDMCMLAAGAPLNIGCKNDFNQKEWNAVSDKLYQELFSDGKLNHEFQYNVAFASWCCHTQLTMQRPSFPVPALPAPGGKPYIVCFIGASFQSRRWTTPRWISLIQMLNAKSDYRIIVAGGKNDEAIASAIAAQTEVENITGAVTLTEMANWVAHARAVVSNDTMAAHLAVSLARPLVLITSGDNFYKFSAYKEACIDGVRSIYPAVFLKKWAQRKHCMFKGYVAVTKDIGTITAHEVYTQLMAAVQ